MQSGISTDIENRIVINAGGSISGRRRNKGSKTATSGASEVNRRGNSELEEWENFGGESQIVQLLR